MSWGAQILVAALLILTAVVYLLRVQRRPSLLRLLRDLGSMHLGEEPRQVLERIMWASRDILDAQRLVVLYYDAEEEQLFRWELEKGHAEPSLTEVPPRELDFWIDLQPGEHAAVLPPNDPILGRLGASRAMSLRVSRGPNCVRVLVTDSNHAGRKRLGQLHVLANNLAVLFENFFMLRRARAKAIDEERARVARDFHDGPLQTFLSFDLHLEFVRKMLERDPKRAAAELELLQVMARKQGRELRDLIQEMRPIDMEGTTLLGLLRGLVQDFEKSGDLRIQLLADSHRVDAPRRVCREVYQVVREAINNARKHAAPRNVVVTIDAQPEELMLTIDDDGKGFQFAGTYTLEELDRLRVGPVSIKQRAHQLGAFLQLESNPGLGARLILRVPLRARKEPPADEAAPFPPQASVKTAAT